MRILFVIFPFIVRVELSFAVRRISGALLISAFKQRFGGGFWFIQCQINFALTGKLMLINKLMLTYTYL